MKILLILVLVAVAALFCGFVYLAYVIFKDGNTARNRRRVYDAICLYQDASRSQGIFKVKVKCSDMEPVEETVKRWWDWGRKRILPADKFEIIKPYLKYVRARRT